MKSSRREAFEVLTGPGKVFELYQDRVWGRSCKLFRNTPLSLRELFTSTRSNNTFVIYEDERYTFEETYQRSCRIAQIIKTKYGIRKGDRVAISMRNFPEWIFIFNAITSIGAIAVAMNALWQSKEMEYGLKDCGASLLFADQERVDRLKPSWDKINTNVVAIRATRILDGVSTLDSLLQTQPDCPMPEEKLNPDDRAMILYTSGSTGKPKGAVSSHRNILSALFSWSLQAEIRSYMEEEVSLKIQTSDNQSATLLAVPLFHATGCLAVMLQSYRAQRKMVCMYKWDTTEAARLIEKEKISGFNGPATMSGDLVDAAKVSGRDLSSLQSVGGGGAPRSPNQVRDIAATFNNAMPSTGWGMTETNSVGTGIGGEDYLQHPNSVGVCHAALEMRVVKDEKVLQAGETGELQIKGASIIEGYWEQPEATKKAFDGEWLRTGDIGYIDTQGYVYIIDRIKDLVIRGGENIGSAEVESALNEHADVIEASVYAVPDERYGEEVGVTIYSQGSPDPEELRDFLKERIAQFKIPRYIEITNTSLPRLASGKINKRDLRIKATKRISA
ncbi:MAG: fatty acid--CoA ligase [Gammaproteobacteria bacterium]|nr:fatty acid--CoA ligase [Gammaproteobacteria bacterium]